MCGAGGFVALAGARSSTTGARSPTLPGMVLLMTNGEGMRGGSVHHTIADHPFLGEVETAPRYRFFSVRDEFPALERVDEGGGVVRGELYDVPLEVLRDSFLTHEPPELELGAVELADGSAALCMILRAGEGGHHEITEYGGWRAYRASQG
jgi:gamma-glutamylcyclotransferase (GGCT)/AIG2-like uncharacterized protein YtfP